MQTFTVHFWANTGHNPAPWHMSATSAQKAARAALDWAEGNVEPSGKRAAAGILDVRNEQGTTIFSRRI